MKARDDVFIIGTAVFINRLDVGAADDDNDVRVVVITGTGKWFCTGGDVQKFADGETKALEETVSSRRPAMYEAVLAINRTGKPVIAAVNRMAAGGGCNLALACDIRLAGDEARFAQVFTPGASTRTGAAYIFCQGWWVTPRPRN